MQATISRGPRINYEGLDWYLSTIDTGLPLKEDGYQGTCIFMFSSIHPALDSTPYKGTIVSQGKLCPIICEMVVAPEASPDELRVARSFCSAIRAEG